MTVRAVEGKKPYTGGKAIEITEDKVINLKLRDENNLIIWDEGDNEIYVDLQLPDEIRPTDAFPVGVNTGRVIVDNGWDVTGTILVFKTTSGDNVKFLYGDDGKLYIDNGTGSFKQIYLKGEVDSLLSELRTYIDGQLALKEDKLTAGANIIIQDVVDPVTGETIHEISATGGGGGGSYTAGTGINIDANNEISVDTTVVATQTDLSSKANASDLNTKTFYLSSTSDLTTAQAAYDWRVAGKNAIIVYDDDVYIQNDIVGADFAYWYTSKVFNENISSKSYLFQKRIYLQIYNGEVMGIFKSNSAYQFAPSLHTGVNYGTPYTPEYDGSPATKKYVDDKQSTISVTLAVNDWSSSTQTVTATGVTSSNTVIVSPDPSSMSDYTSSGVYCSAQGTDSLTFTCSSTPSNAITVNVVILN